MNSVARCCLVLAAAVTSLLVVQRPFADARTTRPWNYSDSIGLRRYTDQTTQFSWDREGQVLFSPRHRRFSAAYTYGDMACDCNVVQLVVFDVDQVASALAHNAVAPSPVANLGFRTTAENWTAIRNLRWLDDDNVAFIGGSVVMKGVAASFTDQLYVYNVPTHQLRKFSHLIKGQNELNPYIHGFTSNAQFALYDQGEWRRRGPEDYPGGLVDQLDTGTLAAGTMQDGIFYSSLYLAGVKGKPKRLSDVGGQRLNPTPILADRIPTGAGVSVAAFATKVGAPARWSEYDGIGVYNLDQAFNRIDLASGKYKPILDAPLGTATQIGHLFGHGFGDATGHWITLRPSILAAADNHFVLVNAALPLASSPEHRATAYVLDYSSNTGQITEITVLRSADGDVQNAALQDDGRCLALTKLRDGQEYTYRYVLEAGNWRLSNYPCSTVQQGLSVKIAQDINTPPRLIAEKNGKQIELIGVDPALEGVSVHKWQEVSWTEPDGLNVKGQILLPADVSHPVPLVILTYHSRPQWFYPDGYFAQYPAQALAEHGIAVLEMDLVAIDRLDVIEKPAEGAAMVARVDAAVTSLVAKKLIDPTRVAAFGFSRGGYMAHYVASFPGKIKLAAAIVDDGFDPSYFGAAIAALDKNPETLNDAIANLGDKPFWLDKENWLKRTTDFNLDSLRTPMLVGGRGGALYPAIHAEMAAAAMTIQAPVQLFRLPYASHQPIRPKERRAWFDASMDWLRFWLQDYQDPAIAKEPMYARWRAMRDHLGQEGK